ncbi:MAG: hypothetical protein ACTSUE_17780 [Promethearchaeota archaeon]
MIEPYTIEEMREIATKMGGRCVAEDILNARTKLEWVCKQGHSFKMTPYNARKGEWCPKCNPKREKKKYTIEYFKKIAEERGGECLSTRYTNFSTKLKFKCEKGHVWEAIPGNIVNGAWCRKCSIEMVSKNQRKSIEEMKDIAKKHGGRCLSKEYKNISTKIKWMCSKGHVWDAVPSSVIAGHWCPVCARNIPLGLDKMRDVAIKRGGECLSTRYINAKGKLKWRCKSGHIFFKSYDSIREGRWCPICAKYGSNIIETMKKIAKKRDGRCLSDTCTSPSTILEWECRNGHVWKMSPEEALARTWCKACKQISKKLFSKNTIEDMKRLGKERGCTCLSNVYVNYTTALRWRCEKGHEFEATPQQARNRKHFCPECKKSAPRSDITIKDMNVIASKGGGKCLSTIYTNSETKLEWECAEGHRWQASPGNVKMGHWCPECANNNRKKVILVIGDMEEIAKRKGGICLSSKMSSYSSPLSWRCKRGHEWEMSPRSAKDGVWCPECKTEEKRIMFTERMHEIARDHGGKFLSPSYINSKVKYKWICGKNHTFQARPDAAKKGWCPECRTKGVAGKKKTIQDMREMAREHGGYCDSKMYINNNTKLDWRCEKGHKWRSIPRYIQQGSWCPECNKTTKKRTHDIEEMKEIAKNHGGECLSKEYKNSSTKIKWKCANGHVFEKRPERARESWCSECLKVTKRNEKLEEFKKIARDRGGECLSTEFVTMHSPLKWRCSEGHEWESRPDHIRKGSWCPKCSRKANKTKYTIDDMKEIARKRKGSCLSEKFSNVNSKLKWRCSEGHEWEATPASILKGSWCLKCMQESMGYKSRDNSIEGMQDIATRRGGVCLSDEYINFITPLKWRCSEGHEWEATPAGIAGGSWCPVCAKTIKKTISDMNALASKKGGRCLSKKYVDRNTELEWECSKGHRWFTKPSNVIRGRWCPTCGGRREKTFDEILEIVGKRGGSCLSPALAPLNQPMEFQCNIGHFFKLRKSELLQGSWCPSCGLRKEYSTSDNILVGEYFTIINKNTYEEILFKINQEKTEKTDSLVKRLNVEFRNDTSGIVELIRGEHYAHYLLMTNKEFDSIRDFTSNFNIDFHGGDLDEYKKKNKPLYVEIIRFARELNSMLNEVNEKSIVSVLTHIIIRCIPGLHIDKYFFEVQEWLEGEFGLTCPRILKRASSYAMDKETFMELSMAIKKELENDDGRNISTTLKRMYGHNLTPLVHHHLGKVPNHYILLSSKPVLEIMKKIIFLHQPTEEELDTSYSINRDFYNEMSKNIAIFKSNFSDILKRDTTPIIPRFFEEYLQNFHYQTLRSYILDDKAAYVHDSFPKSSISNFSYFLGVMLSEGRFHDTGERSPALIIGPTNTLVFFDHYLPLIRHESMDGKQKILSPEFVNWLIETGILDEDLNKHPRIFGNKELFLAGLFDVRGISPKRNETHLHIDIPFKNFSEWLEIIPFQYPITISGVPILDDGIKDKFQPWEYPFGEQGVNYYIFGRKFPEYSNTPDEQCAKIIAKNLKYFMEEVFPHCVHPKLDSILEFGFYLQDDYGEYQPNSYSHMVKEELKLLGGINLKGIKRTISRKVLDPETRNLLIYIPDWLMELNREKGYGEKDILTSYQKFGEFNPLSFFDDESLS